MMLAINAHAWVMDEVIVAQLQMEDELEALL